MASTVDPTRADARKADLLADYARGRPRGSALRAWLAERFPDRPAEEIEDAVQSACASFLGEGAGVSDPGAVYAWLRTAAHRSLLRELKVRRRSGPADPAEGALGTLVSGLALRLGGAFAFWLGLISLLSTGDVDAALGALAGALAWLVGQGHYVLRHGCDAKSLLARVILRGLADLLDC